MARGGGAAGRMQINKCIHISIVSSIIMSCSKFDSEPPFENAILPRVRNNEQVARGGVAAGRTYICKYIHIYKYIHMYIVSSIMMSCSKFVSRLLLCLYYSCTLVMTGG